jgi:NAD(P)-dependent dehydrogenase (short-subunit alcohol dehydrogenase family)
MDEAAKGIEGIIGRKIIPMALDVTSFEQVDSVMAKAVKHLGGLDILVNSAALPGGPPSTASESRCFCNMMPARKFLVESMNRPK